MYLRGLIFIQVKCTDKSPAHLSLKEAVKRNTDWLLSIIGFGCQESGSSHPDPPSAETLTPETSHCIAPIDNYLSMSYCKRIIK